MYDATFKIVLFGDDNTGKVKLLEDTTSVFSSSSLKTIGADFTVKNARVDQQKVKLQVWYFSGGEEFKYAIPTYVRAAKGGMFVFDVANKASLEHIDEWLDLIRKEIKAGEEFPIIGVGIHQSSEKKRDVSYEEAQNMMKVRDLDGYIECHLTTGENVDKIFEELTRLILNFRFRNKVSNE